MLAFLHALRERGQLTNWNQVAFLFHSVRNRQAVGLARFLEENGIPVYAPRSNQFFEREEVRLMIGALIALFPQFPEVRKWNEDAHLAIWEYYDQECFGFFMERAREPENEGLLKWVRAMRRVHFPLTQPTDYAFSGLFYQLLQFPLFSRYLDEDLLLSGFHDRRPMYNLAQFSRMLSKYALV